MQATGETVEALRRAMLPHLAKLDVILLQKAIRAAKEDGSVDEKLIKTAEGKLSQAQRRATTSDEQQAGKRDAALETLQAAMKSLQAAIEEAEAHHVDANKTSEAWAKLDTLEKPVLAQLAPQQSPDSVVPASGDQHSAADLSPSAPAQSQAIPSPTALPPRPDLLKTVTAWLKTVTAWQQTGAVHDAKREALSEAEELHKRFLTDPKAIRLQYGSVKNFHAGLEGMLGSPVSDVMHAMESEHSSQEPFKALNANAERVTTPHAEWVYVAEKRAGEEVSEVKGVTINEVVEGQTKTFTKHPSHKADLAGPQVPTGQHDKGRDGWTLQNFWQQEEPQKAGLMLEEVAGLRLYTGPMYVPYQAVLRGLNTKSEFLMDMMLKLCCPKDIFGQYKAGEITLKEALQTVNRYTTTLHAINSGIVKLSRLTKATTVYRGVSGVLPEDFWRENDHGVKGGVELGFMSTTTSRATAIEYANQQTPTAKMLFEIKMGMIDRGADLGCLSQFDENEILFAPLTGLEPHGLHVEDGVLVIELRLSCNLKDQTLEQVVGRMKTSHLAFVNTMMDNLRLGIHGLPPTVLIPLEEAKAHAEAHDHTYFNQAKNYMEATTQALEASDACYAKLAVDDTWAAAKGDGTAAAGCMRKAAEKCANEERPKQAAALLVMAVEQADVAAKHQAKVAQLLSTNRQSAVAVRPVLEATSMLLAEHGSDGQWKPTLVELCVLVGDRHIVGRLSQMHGLPENYLWAIQPAPEYPDLPLDGYKAQPYFHQINTRYPGLQLIQDSPHVFLAQNFFTPEECQHVRDLFTLSSEKGPSATFEAQTNVRTSTSVIYGVGSEPPLLKQLRERIAVLARVGTDQLQATKISCYEKGQFFGRHTDAQAVPTKHAWLCRLWAGAENAEQLTAAGEYDCFVPDRFCTVWIYLNDVEEGGHTTFHSSEERDDLYTRTLPLMGTVLGKDAPGVPCTRSKQANLRVKPKAGTAMIHFPTTTKEYMCVTDGLAIHEGEKAVDPKYILQQFIWSEPLETVLKNAQKRGVGSTADNRKALFGHD